jgi:hypothetical protein
MKNKFECYYYITNPETIILDKPDFIEKNNVGFIFGYIFFISGFCLALFVFVSGLTTRYYRNEYSSINN